MPKPTSMPSYTQWNFDLDHYLNHFVPASPLHRLPAPVSRFLGYRSKQGRDVGNVMGAWWSFVGAFCGLVVIAKVFGSVEAIRKREQPMFVASFGASAILEYNAIRSPLGQPRNALLGHTFSALVGVSITKLFLLHPNFDSLRWIAAALSCGLASALMLLTGTVHPPGGASAVLAATDASIIAMGWYFVGLVMFGTTLMLGVGLLINNIQRQFPVYWWTPMGLGKARRVDEEVEVCAEMEEKGTAPEVEDMQHRIHISPFEFRVPEGLGLGAEEVRMLQGLRARLRGRVVLRGRDGVLAV